MKWAHFGIKFIYFIKFLTLRLLVLFVGGFKIYLGEY